MEAIVKFKNGKTYGNDFKVLVISQTEKFITFESNGFGIRKVKKSKSNLTAESFSFGPWLIDATELN